jgi:predicted PurR-regulated permease PerM
VSGDTFLRRIVELLPKFRDKRQAVDISQQIERDVSAYLVTITAMNAAVGIATAAAMYLCGLGDPCCGGPQPSCSTTFPFWGRCLGPASFSSPEC